MRELQLIPFPGVGFALQNSRSKAVSSVIPLGQRGQTGAKFKDGTTILVDIEAHDPSAVFVSLAEEEDFFPCPVCGRYHNKETYILIEGSTLSVAAVVRISRLSLRSGGIFGQRPLSLNEILTRPSSFDSLMRNTKRPTRPRDQSPTDMQARSRAVDGMVEEFFDPSVLKEDDLNDDKNDSDSTDVVEESVGNAPASELGGDGNGFDDVFGDNTEGPVDPNSFPPLGMSTQPTAEDAARPDLI